MILSLIVAKDLNGLIGNNNELPWEDDKMVRDMNWFKKHTHGKAIIMGRKTWDSLPMKPLPYRLNLILSRQGYSDSMISYKSVKEAIAEAKHHGYEECVFIGGSSLYRQVEDIVQVRYETNVLESFEGDRHYFGDYSNKWNLTSSETYEADEDNIHACQFQIWKKGE